MYHGMNSRFNFKISHCQFGGSKLCILHPRSSILDSFYRSSGLEVLVVDCFTVLSWVRDYSTSRGKERWPPGTFKRRLENKARYSHKSKHQSYKHKTIGKEDKTVSYKDSNSMFFTIPHSPQKTMCSDTTSSTTPTNTTTSQERIVATTDHTETDRMDNEQELEAAKELIQESYELIWRQEDIPKAVFLLEQALAIQRKCLGKHHKDVGYTCNFIGLGFWRLGAGKRALPYFFEARRIMCKSGNRGTKAIDQRIRCILFLDMEFSLEDVARYHSALRDSIEHELTADRLKKDGEHEEAKKEYRLAKEAAKPLANLVRG
mmetsp:Transcript_30837/g.51242  ORF Transcript_30837/g.51242 Transcript_30837/m.51242 type:complete len:318 (-) Transcript_30837:1145-2098(-)